jgi:lauroyl/myristoyl acyltransferase
LAPYILNSILHQQKIDRAYGDLAELRTTPGQASAPGLAALPLFTLNDLLWLFYLYPVRWLARVLPRSMVYAVGRVADPLVQFYARGRKSRAIPWIAEACRTTPDHAKDIARRALSHNLFGTLDDLLILRSPSQATRGCDGVDGLQHLDEAIARGKGVILLAGHFCANLVAWRYLASQGYPALSLHQRRTPNVAQGRLGKRFLQPRRAELRKIAFPDQAYVQDPDCSLTILRRLRAGGLVTLLIDGRAGTSPVEQPFLGRLQRVPSGILEIIRLSNCAVVPILSLGRGDGFRIRLDPMLDIVSAPSRDAFAAANLPRFLAVVERQVVENPEEWRLWINFLSGPG